MNRWYLLLTGPVSIYFTLRKLNSCLRFWLLYIQVHFFPLLYLIFVPFDSTVNRKSLHIFILLRNISTYISFTLVLSLALFRIQECNYFFPLWLPLSWLSRPVLAACADDRRQCFEITNSMHFQRFNNFKKLLVLSTTFYILYKK